MTGTPCVRCRQLHTEKFMVSEPYCVNTEACKLRIELHNLRAAMLKIAGEMSGGAGYASAWARIIREECGKQ